jgi:hypothetical protein
MGEGCFRRESLFELSAAAYGKFAKQADARNNLLQMTE